MRLFIFIFILFCLQLPAEIDFRTVDDWNIFSSSESTLIISKEGSNDRKQFLGFKMEQPWCVCTDPVFSLKAGEEGKLFGSVTTQMISDELAEQGLKLDKKEITLEDS